MKPSDDEIIDKYNQEIKNLKQELKQLTEVEQRSESPLTNYESLLDYEVTLLRKGVRNRRTEIETHLHKCYTIMGRYINKKSKI